MTESTKQGSRKRLFISPVPLLIVCHFLAGTILSEQAPFRFNYYIDDPNVWVAPDIFIGVADTDPNAAVDFDVNDLRQPPSPPWDYARANTVVNDIDIIRDNRPLDVNTADLSYPVGLYALGSNPSGFTGTCSFNLVNAEALELLADDTMVYIKKYDANGVFQGRYDLRESENHLICWSVTDASGPQGIMELKLLDKCEAANLDGLGLVNFGDFVRLAQDWQKTGAGLAGDVDDDEVVDVYDLIIFSEFWLNECCQ